MIAGRAIDIRARAVAWVKADPPGEFAEIQLESRRLRARGVAIGSDPEPYRLSFELQTREEYITDRAVVETQGAGWTRQLEIQRSPTGVWSASSQSAGKLEMPESGGDPAEPVANQRPGTQGDRRAWKRPPTPHIAADQEPELPPGPTRRGRDACARQDRDVRPRSSPQMHAAPRGAGALRTTATPAAPPRPIPASAPGQTETARRHLHVTSSQSSCFISAGSDRLTWTGFPSHMNGTPHSNRN